MLFIGSIFLFLIRQLYSFKKLPNFDTLNFLIPVGNVHDLVNDPDVLIFV